MDGLAAALALLPPGQLACWLLRELDDRSDAEIAAALNISEQTVRAARQGARDSRKGWAHGI